MKAPRRPLRKPIHCTIVVPVFNEAKRVAAGLRGIIQWMRTCGHSYEIIVVNDGSTDRTQELIRRVVCGKHTIRVIRYRRNRGKGYAVKRGVRQATGRFIFFVDIDLSTPIGEVARALPWLEQGYDLVAGSRKMFGARIVVPQAWYRRMLGKGFTSLANCLLGMRVSDFTCGFKGFKREVAQHLFSLQQVNRWVFDAEVLFLAGRCGYKIKELPVRWRDDSHTRVRMSSDIVRSFVELLRVRLNDWCGVYNYAALSKVVPRRSDSVKRVLCLAYSSSRSG